MSALMSGLAGSGHPQSVQLDAREFHHLAPLIGFVDDELAEVGGRPRNHHYAKVGETRLDLGIGEARIDLFVEPVDNLRGRVLRRADAEPLACLITRYEISHGW